MQFKIGDKVKYVVNAPSYVKERFFNKNGVGIVIKMCPVVHGCVIVKCPNQREHHTYAEYLKRLSISKGQQLLFEFMET